MTMKITGKIGALTSYQITDYVESDVQKIKQIAEYYVSESEGVLSGATNKRCIAALQNFVAKSTIVKTTVKPLKNNTRHIELTDNITTENHGKSWICTGFDVDRFSLNPAWQGEFICYIYE